jgi:hypothetical protein
VGVLLVHSLSEGDIMRISVGIDIAKEIHWVCAVDAEGRVQIDRKMVSGAYRPFLLEACGA